MTFLIKSKNKLTFRVDKVVKTSEPGKNYSVEVEQYDEDHKICPYKCLIEYLLKTEKLKIFDQLLITLQKSHRVYHN